MVICLAPNKNKKVVEEQAVWRGTNCYVTISLIKFQQFARFWNIHQLITVMVRA